MIVRAFELADVRLFKTADFDCSRSGNLRTVFGIRLRLLFAIGSGLHRRGEKRYPAVDLLTSRAFMRSDAEWRIVLAIRRLDALLLPTYLAARPGKCPRRSVTW